MKAVLTFILLFNYLLFVNVTVGCVKYALMGAMTSGSAFWAFYPVLFPVAGTSHITSFLLKFKGFWHLIVPSVTHKMQYLMPVHSVFYFSCTIIIWMCDLQIQRHMWITGLISRISLLLSQEFSKHYGSRMGQNFATSHETYTLRIDASLFISHEVPWT